jgi:hypothetical protein
MFNSNEGTIEVMDKDCRNCTHYKYIPKDITQPYGEEWCNLTKNDFGQDYSPCDKYSEHPSLLSEITVPQKNTISIIESNLNIKFCGLNKGNARDFIRKNINKSKQHRQENSSFSPHSMIIGCHGLPIDKADFYQCLAPNQ